MQEKVELPNIETVKENVGTYRRGMNLCKGLVNINTLNTVCSKF